MSNNTRKPAKTVAAATSRSGSTPATRVAAAKPAPGKAAVKRPVTRAAKPAALAVRKKAPATRVAATAKPAVRKAVVRTPVSAVAKPTLAKRPVDKVAPAKKSVKPVKAKKVKLVRDSFTMPETEYAVIADLKARCLAAGVSAKKSEVLRAAVAGLAKLGDAALLAAIRKLDVIKTGRPAKQAK
ncbi:MAG: hypothetical protein ABL877_10445 [Thiobacillus sp.]